MSSSHYKLSHKRTLCELMANIVLSSQLLQYDNSELTVFLQAEHELSDYSHIILGSQPS
jgi:hypothetical protein